MLLFGVLAVCGNFLTLDLVRPFTLGSRLLSVPCLLDSLVHRALVLPLSLVLEDPFVYSSTLCPCVDDII